MSASVPDSARNRTTRLVSTSLVLLAGSLIAYLVIHDAQQRGLSPAVLEFIRAADVARETGSLPNSAIYPPLVTLLALGVRTMGVATINPYFFNFCLFAIGLVVMLGMARRYLKHEWLACAAVLLALLNPYFVWTAMLSKDTSAELLFLSAFLWLVAIACEESAANTPSRRWQLGVGIVVSAVLLSLTRVTGVFMTFSILLIAYFVSHARWQKRFHACCAGAFLIFVVAFCAYNQTRVGAFALATNGGYNLYIGNHPAYLHGHPHYDIDVFLRSVDLHEDLSSLGEAELNREYTKRARALILADPAAFVYRVVVKSVWHWFNIEKIPNYTSASEVVGPTNGEGWQARLSSIHIMPSLAYLLYKFAYLPVFILGLVAVARGKLDRRFALLYGPMFGLWPVVALTFPDTRFKMSAEVVLLPVLVAVVSHWRNGAQSGSFRPTATE